MDIRDHGGAFSRRGVNNLNPIAVVADYYTGIYQIKSNGDVFGWHQGRFTAGKNYYHRDKNGNVIKGVFNETGAIVNYVEDGYCQVSTNGKTIHRYNHSGQLVESFSPIGLETNEQISQGVRIGDKWAISLFNNGSAITNKLCSYSLGGTLISSVQSGERLSLTINPFGNVIGESSGYSVSADNVNHVLACFVVERSGYIREFVPFRSHSFNNQNISLVTFNATLAQLRMAFLNDK